MGRDFWGSLPTPNTFLKITPLPPGLVPVGTRSTSDLDFIGLFVIRWSIKVRQRTQDTYAKSRYNACVMCVCVFIPLSYLLCVFYFSGSYARIANLGGYPIEVNIQMANAWYAMQPILVSSLPCFFGPYFMAYPIRLSG